MRPLPTYHRIKLFAVLLFDIFFLPIQGLPLTMLKILSHFACWACFLAVGQIQPNNGVRRRSAQALLQDHLKNIELYNEIYHKTLLYNQTAMKRWLLSRYTWNLSSWYWFCIQLCRYGNINVYTVCLLHARYLHNCPWKAIKNKHIYAVKESNDNVSPTTEIHTNDW